MSETLARFRPSLLERYKSLAADIGNRGKLVEIELDGKDVRGYSLSFSLPRTTSQGHGENRGTLTFIPPVGRKDEATLLMTRIEHTNDDAGNVVRATRTFRVGLTADNVFTPSSTKEINGVSPDGVYYPPMKDTPPVTVYTIADRQRQSGVRLYLAKMENMADISF